MTVSLGRILEKVLYTAACAEDWEGKISDSKGKRVVAVGRVMRSRPLDPVLFVALSAAAAIFIAR